MLFTFRASCVSLKSSPLPIGVRSTARSRISFASAYIPTFSYISETCVRRLTFDTRLQSILSAIFTAV